MRVAPPDGFVVAWRSRLRDAGMGANDPVCLFPYSAFPDYRRPEGLSDDRARERAVDHDLATFAELEVAR